MTLIELLNRIDELEKVPPLSLDFERGRVLEYRNVCPKLAKIVRELLTQRDVLLKNKYIDKPAGMERNFNQSLAIALLEKYDQELEKILNDAG